MTPHKLMMQTASVPVEYLLLNIMQLEALDRIAAKQLEKNPKMFSLFD